MDDIDFGKYERLLEIKDHKILYDKISAIRVVDGIEVGKFCSIMKDIYGFEFSHDDYVKEFYDRFNERITNVNKLAEERRKIGERMAKGSI